MTVLTARVAAVVTLLALASTTIPASAAVVNDDPDGRVLRVERWLKATLAHTPGEVDDAVRAIDAWTNRDLQALNIDENVIAQLIRDPNQRAIRVPSATTPRYGQPKPKFPYNDWQMHRLRVLACAAAGMLKADPCVHPLNAQTGVDEELWRLNDRAQASHTSGDDNFILRRGAMLHGDVAMFSPGTLDPLDTSSLGGSGSFRVQMSDGQPGAVGAAPIHWVIARMLLDAIAPKPDDMARQWYIATNMWMQAQQQHNTDHLRHAREMFPNDADLLFLSGCQLEAYASAAIQSVVRSTSLPDGYSLNVPNESVALGDAEDFFKRALARDPQRREARIRLGHVLLARGRWQQAADDLETVDADSQPPILQYFHALFSGAAAEGLGHLDQARESYARAGTLYSSAQTPHLALAALATRRGDRAGALREIQTLFDLPAVSPTPEDPWWLYYVAQARNTTFVFDEFYNRYADH